MLNLGCWTARQDIYGLGGTYHEVDSVNECMNMCINNKSCVAFDWDDVGGTKCRMLTSTATTTKPIEHWQTHYILDRDCNQGGKFVIVLMLLLFVG